MPHTAYETILTTVAALQEWLHRQFPKGTFEKGENYKIEKTFNDLKTATMILQEDEKKREDMPPRSKTFMKQIPKKEKVSQEERARHWDINENFDALCELMDRKDIPIATKVILQTALIDLGEKIADAGIELSDEGLAFINPRAARLQNSQTDIMR